MVFFVLFASLLRERSVFRKCRAHTTAASTIGFGLKLTAEAENPLDWVGLKALGGLEENFDVFGGWAIVQGCKTLVFPPSVSTWVHRQVSVFCLFFLQLSSGCMCWDSLGFFFIKEERRIYHFAMPTFGGVSSTCWMGGSLNNKAPRHSRTAFAFVRHFPRHGVQPPLHVLLHRPVSILFAQVLAINGLAHAFKTGSSFSFGLWVKSLHCF